MALYHNHRVQVRWMLGDAQHLSSDYIGQQLQLDGMKLEMLADVAAVAESGHHSNTAYRRLYLVILSVYKPNTKHNIIKPL